MRTSGFVVWSVLLVLAGAAIEANAQQSYPRRPITYVVPYGPGSGNDVIARIVANCFVLVPAATPKPVVAQLSAEFVKAIAAPDVRERLQAGGVEPTSITPEEAREDRAAGGRALGAYREGLGYPGRMKHVIRSNSRRISIA